MPVLFSYYNAIGSASYGPHKQGTLLPVDCKNSRLCL